MNHKYFIPFDNMGYKIPIKAILREKNTKTRKIPQISYSVEEINNTVTHNYDIHVSNNRKRYNFICKIQDNGDFINRQINLNRKKISFKVINISPNLKIEGMVIYIDYRDSKFYISNKYPFYVLIESKSMNWTGSMSSLNFYQLIDIKNQIFYEFIQ